jgi:hypothetical protein
MRGFDSFELTSRYLRVMIQASSVQQQPDAELLGCLLAMRGDSEGEKEELVSPEFKV